MSWKPCRGSRMALDKAVKDSHECYFKFFETSCFVEKSKIAFKWMKAEMYFGRKPFYMLGKDFLEQCKTNNKVYKPLLKLLVAEGVIK